MPTPTRVLLSFICSGRAEILIRSLTAACDQQYPDFEVFVVDCSPRPLEDALKTRFPGLIYCRKDTDSGIASNRNFAMRKYMSWKHDLVFLLDDDIQLEKDCLSTLVTAIKEDPTVGLAVPLILNENGSVLSGGGIYYKPFGQPRLMRKSGRQDLDFASGAIGLYRKEILAAVGTFDADFDPYGFEDIDYGLRLNEKGFRIRLVETAVCRHLTSYSFHNEQAFFLYHTTKHRLICARKHLGPLSFVFAAFPWFLLRRVVFPAIKFALQGENRLSFEVIRGFKDGLARCLNMNSG